MFKSLVAVSFAWTTIGIVAAADCPAPKFTVSDFRAGADARDRGYPGGISMIDADGDGDLDVYASQGYDVTTGKLVPRRSTLYLNDGKGRFTYAPESALTTAAEPASGSTWADIDSDGDLDAFVSTQLGRTDAFYRNRGRAHFDREDLGDATSTKGSNFTASWADIDGDGDLDLYVGGPTLEPPQPTLVYRNDKGTYTRVQPTILDNGANNPGAALWADVDNDGDQDLLVANSDIARKSDLAAAPVEYAVLYRNDGGWAFTRTSGHAFETAALPALTAAFGDIDNDGDLDLFLGLYADGKQSRRDRLFLNDGKGTFAEAPNAAFAEHLELASGAAFADLNLDGNLDLIVTSDESAPAIYIGKGNGEFAPIADQALAARKSTHWSIATGDLNADGRPDAVIGNWGETSAGAYATLLTNETPRCGAWSEIALRDRNGAPNPPGARVTLITRTPAGRERRQLREAAAQTGFRSQSASFFLFGVPAGETIVAAEIRWPDGRQQRVAGFKTNVQIRVTAR